MVTGKEYVKLCRQLDKQGDDAAKYGIDNFNDEAERMETAVNAMVEAVKKHGWDGTWYLRAYDFYGNKIGSSRLRSSTCRYSTRTRLLP